MKNPIKKMKSRAWRETPATDEEVFHQTLSIFWEKVCEEVEGRALAKGARRAMPESKARTHEAPRPKI